MLYADLKKRLDGAKANPDEINKLVELLKDSNNSKYPDIEKLKKEYEPEGHDIMDESIRKPKPIYGGPNETLDPVSGAPKPGEAPPIAGQTRRGKQQERIIGYEQPTRVALPFQWSITESRVNFAFGLPVTLECNPAEGPEKELYDLITKIRKKNKIETIDRVFAREAQRATRAAEFWFFVKESEKSNTYGKPLDGKVRCAVWQPFKGDGLYPFFDDFGDMIAFSRAYSIYNEDNKQEQVFEVFTSEFRYSWKQISGQTKWQQTKDAIANPYGKIPVVYVDFEKPAWHYVRTPIARLETLVSDHADTNSYHASPKIFIKGKIQNFIKKGETGGLIQGDKDTDAKYLSWDTAPESTKLEAEMLLRFIYGFTNTPDMTFEQMAKMTNPSGETMKMLFMAAHLQVKSDSEKYNDWQERRINLMKSMIGVLWKDLKEATQSLEIEPKINPFMIDDEAGRIDSLMKANAGKALISQKTAISKSGLVDNIEEELANIQAEQDAQDDRDAKNAQRQNVAFE